MTEFAKTYASALYALAEEEKKEDALLEQAKQLGELLKAEPDYLRLIDLRSVPKQERLSLLDGAFAGRVDAYLLNFMKLLAERGAFCELPGCLTPYAALYDEAHGILPAKCVSAKPMTEAQTARLVEALEKRTGKQIRLSVSVDPSLGGGMRVEMAGQRLDNTLAARMDRLRRALVPKP